MASIFSLFGEIFIDNTNANKSIDSTTEKAEKSGSKVGSAFTSITKGAVAVGTAVVGAATAIGGAAYKMASDTSASADEIDKMSQKIGLSKTAYQEWDYVLSQNGMDVSKLQTGVKTLTTQMDAARKGAGKSSDAFKALGVSVTNADGSLRSQEEVFNETIAALQGVENETERARLANQLFGRSGTELAPLLNQSAASVEALKNKAHELGMVMSDEAVDAGVKFSDTMDTLKRSFGGILNTVGTAVIPIVQKTADLFQDNMPRIHSFIERMTPVVTSLFETALPPLFDLAVTLLPMLFSLFESLAPLLGEIISVVLPPIVSLLELLLPLTVTIVQTVLPPILSLLQQLLPYAVQIIQAILPPLVSLLQQILPYAVQIIDAVLPILIQLLDLLLPPLLQIVQTILPILSSLLDALLPLLQPILDLLTVLLEPLFDLLELILPPICDFIELLTSTLLPPLQAAFSGVAEIVSGAFSLAFQALSGVFDSVKQVLRGIVDFIGGIFTGDWERVWNGVVSIFRGIFNLIPSIVESVINGAIWVINGIIDGINWALGWTGVDLDHIPDVQLPRLRIGLDYVPYDDYPALLHKGERVLTESESKEYSEYEQQKKPTVVSQSENADGSINIIIQFGERSIVIENLNGKDPDEIDSFVDEILEIIDEKIKRRGVIFG
jgi:phage-related protein